MTLSATADKWLFWLLLHIGDHCIKHYFFFQAVRLYTFLCPICTGNHFELAWAQIKGHIKANAEVLNLSEAEQLAWEWFGIIGARTP